MLKTKRKDNLYLRDIKEALAKIEQYTRKLSLDDFDDDRKTVDAVVRNIEIIGEAAKNISVESRKKHIDIPWKKMVGMRNKVIHEYFGVDVDILWQTIKEDLPGLKKKISKIS
jgi:uncharacterized protein with HEPN domain